MKLFKLIMTGITATYCANASVFLLDESTQERYLKDYINGEIPLFIVYTFEKKEPEFLTAPTEQMSQFLELDDKIRMKFLYPMVKKRVANVLENARVIEEVAKQMNDDLDIKPIIAKRKQIYDEIIKNMPIEELNDFNFWCSKLYYYVWL